MTLLLLRLLSSWALAIAPNSGTYQGRLQESGLPVSGARQLELLLCNATSGGACFTSGVQGVSVLNGVFKSTFTLPAGADLTTGNWHLEVRVGPFGGGLNTLTPREALASFPYAVHASSATTLLGSILPAQVAAGTLDSSVIAQSFPVGGIPTAALANLGVTAAKLADGAVETAKLAVASVDSTKLAAGAVGTTKLARDAVDSTKILAGTIDTTRLAPDSVDTGKILASAVTGPKLAAGSVETPKLAIAAVTTPKLAEGAVTNSKLADLAVDANKLALGAVTGVKIAGTSIDTTKMQPDAITTSALINFSVTLSKLAPNSIDSSKMLADSVAAAAIQNAAVGTQKIALGAVDTNRLAAAAVTGEKLAAGALMIGTRGIDKLGAKTRMGFATGAGTITLNLIPRRHMEVFIHVPPLLASTDVRVQFNSLAPGNYAVTRSTGGAPYSSVSAPGIDILGVPLTLPAGSQLQIRLVLDGNTGTPSLLTGTFSACSFQGTAFAPVHVSGSFGVNMGGERVSDVSVLGVTSSLPSGTYVVAYGEEFP